MVVSLEPLGLIHVTVSRLTRGPGMLLVVIVQFKVYMEPATGDDPLSLILKTSGGGAARGMVIAFCLR